MRRQSSARETPRRACRSLKSWLGVHKIGHVEAFDEIALDTATHFAFRDECMSCPVVQLCKGSCMFLEGDFFAQSCANEFAFNMGIMMAAIWHLTGEVLVEITQTDGV